QSPPFVIAVSGAASERHGQFDDLAAIIPFEPRHFAERVNGLFQIAESIVTELAAMRERIDRGNNVSALIVFPPELGSGLVGQLRRQRVADVIEPANGSVRMRDADAVKLRIV